ncbi:MAG: hypothetical protein MUO63_01145, partial [Desulfobulbaceae bacterium]|nr:hypothetical protein [Desulfobulbaceae bacterium]
MDIGEPGVQPLFSPHIILDRKPTDQLVPERIQGSRDDVCRVKPVGGVGGVWPIDGATASDTPESGAAARMADFLYSRPMKTSERNYFTRLFKKVHRPAQHLEKLRFHMFFKVLSV